MDGPDRKPTKVIDRHICGGGVVRPTDTFVTWTSLPSPAWWSATVCGLTVNPPGANVPRGNLRNSQFPKYTYQLENNQTKNVFLLIFTKIKDVYQVDFSPNGSISGL